jgi:hypothetical protein
LLLPPIVGVDEAKRRQPMSTSGKGIPAVVLALVLGFGVTSFAACLQRMAEGLVQYFVARATF